MLTAVMQLKNKFIASFIIIVGTLSFPIEQWLGVCDCQELRRAARGVYFRRQLHHREHHRRQQQHQQQTR